MVAVIEVKKDWNLNYRNKGVIQQAYHYALETGSRFVIITNGDYYAVFDTNKGKTYESHFLGKFKISEFEPKGLSVIYPLKKE